MEAAEPQRRRVGGGSMSGPPTALEREEAVDRRQSPCPCVVCSRDEPSGCYGSDVDRTTLPDQKCWVEACVCWGGEDRECEACWIDGK